MLIVPQTPMAAGQPAAITGSVRGQ